MHGQAKRPQAEIWGRHGVPDPGWGPGRSGTPIKLKIRVLIRESGCPNLDNGGRVASPPHLRFDSSCPANLTSPADSFAR
jgi:hypothetical protein